MNNLKLCIYAICKNEIIHLEKWYEHAKQADYVYVLDTGSTDGTLEKLTELDIAYSQQIYDVFSFAKAKNESLTRARQFANTNDWIFLCLDIDEYLEDGGADRIKEQWQDTFDIGVLSISNAKGWLIGRCHSANSDLFWDYALHEAIRSKTRHTDDLITYDFDSVTVYHDQDESKPRSYYEILKTAIANEGPRVRYLVFAYCEAWYKGRHTEARAFINRAIDQILNNPNDDYYQNYTWLAFCYYYVTFDYSLPTKIGIYEQLIDYISQGKLRDFRNAHYLLHKMYLENNEIDKAVAELEKCLKIKEPLNSELHVDDYSLYNNNKIYTELELICYYHEKYLQAVAYAFFALQEDYSELNRNNLQLCMNKYNEVVKGEN